jgi:hypothetical protein
VPGTLVRSGPLDDKKIDDMGQTHNTIVVFTTDNARRRRYAFQGEQADHLGRRMRVPSGHALAGRRQARHLEDRNLRVLPTFVEIWVRCKLGLREEGEGRRGVRIARRCARYTSPVLEPISNVIGQRADDAYRKPSPEDAE